MNIGDYMKKVLLIDGNNILFRSYYATAYTGNIMKNSKGFPTNALYGFVGMMNKIIHEEKQEYVAVAFDIGKNFRKQKYETYKDGRSETPEELKMQMPIAREILDGMGISDYKVVGNDTIYIYEQVDNLGAINKALANADVMVNLLNVVQERLENYFLELVGGEENA